MLVYIICVVLALGGGYAGGLGISKVLREKVEEVEDEDEDEEDGDKEDEEGDEEV